MDETLCGVGYVRENDAAEGDDGDRVSHVLQRADELLAHLDDDTVFEGVPPQLAGGTSDELDAYDTVVEPPLDEDELDDDMLATLTTNRASQALVVAAPPPYLQAPVPPSTPARRSMFARIVDAIRRLFGRAPEQSPLEDEIDYDESSAWTYTVSDRRVAQARSHRIR